VDSQGLRRVREFYEEQVQSLFSYALALTRCRAAAEDAVHEAVCRILSRSTPPDDLRPYAFRCVRNAAIDARRRQRPSEPVSVLDLEGTTDGNLERVLFAQVEEHLLALPTDEMEAVLLHLVDGLTFREIAGVKGAPLNTVASWYRRGVERLREKLGGNE
jgi:RNA polymerase sigma-70 factor (ECF subfamily)